MHSAGMAAPDPSLPDCKYKKSIPRSRPVFFCFLTSPQASLGSVLKQKNHSRAVASCIYQCTRRDSNPQPSESESDILSIELRVQIVSVVIGKACKINYLSGF